ncbi:c-type cytochrome biogenesis protein CcmI [Salinisphaera orenii]|uniref:c-type cytochrome biogenesis protein CcmI n=1 Tax=Salinisphaera orenii TaxID=856731 RepID=UPI000DBE9530
MIAFGLIAALLTAASALCVLLPLWRGHERDSTESKRLEANRTIYRQNYRDIESAETAGRLAPAHAAQQKDELGRRLLAETEPDDAPESSGVTSSAARRPWRTSVVVVTLTIVAPWFAYAYLGGWPTPGSAPSASETGRISRLQARVRSEPANTNLRIRLAQAQLNQQQYVAAATNLRRINSARSTPDAQLLAAEAEARYRASDSLEGWPTTLFKRALRVEPTNQRALWYLGLAAAEHDDTERALDYWNRLLAQDLPDARRQRVRDRRDALAGDKPGLARSVN